MENCMPHIFECTGCFSECPPPPGKGSLVPPGGAKGQYLSKASDEDGELMWSNLPLASTTQYGIVELATALTTDAGVSEEMAVTPFALANSALAKEVQADHDLLLELIDDTTGELIHNKLSGRDALDAHPIKAIDGLSELIPDQANADNQLADKNFVKSSIEHYALPQATETVMGGAMLATRAEVRAKINAMKVLTPARIPDLFAPSSSVGSDIFLNFNPQTMMGVCYATSNNAGPLYDVEGYASTGYYIVHTTGLAETQYRLFQFVTETVTRRSFSRYAFQASGNITWSAWQELPNGTDKSKFDFYSVGKTSNANPTNIWHRAFTTTVRPASTTDWSSAIVVQGNYPVDSAGSAFGILNIYMRGSNLRCRWHYRTSSINNANFVLCSDANDPMKVELWIQAGNWQSYKLSILASGALAARPNEAIAWPPLQTNLDNGLTDIPADLVSRIVSTDNLPFVELGTQNPLIDYGSGAVGTSTKAAREDHVHPASGGGSTLQVKGYYEGAGFWPINDVTPAKPLYIVVKPEIAVGADFRITVEDSFQSDIHAVTQDTGRVLTLIPYVSSLGLGTQGTINGSEITQATAFVAYQ